MEREPKYIDEFVKHAKDFITKHKIVHFRQKPFYGRVEFNIQNGEWAYSRIEYTEK